MYTVYGRASGGNSVDPVITVNVTPNQLAQGASWAASNASTINAAAGAVSGASGSGGGGGSNPFFGNKHLGNQQ